MHAFSSFTHSPTLPTLPLPQPPLGVWSCSSWTFLYTTFTFFLFGNVFPSLVVFIILLSIFYVPPPHPLGICYCNEPPLVQSFNCLPNCSFTKSAKPSQFLCVVLFCSPFFSSHLISCLVLSCLVLISCIVLFFLALPCPRPPPLPLYAPNLI